MAVHLDLTYRHDGRTSRPLPLTPEDIRRLAWDVRRGLGCGADGALAVSIERLMAIETVRVNGVAYGLAWSVDGPVTNEDGRPVLGVCEYDHRGMPGTALLLANPVLADGHRELILSTLAHELGHGLFDAPAWIVAANPARHPRASTLDDRPMPMRTVIAGEDHLQLPASSAPDHRAEWRANEFMGSLLVPCPLLVERIAFHARSTGVDLPAPTAGLPPVAGPPPCPHPWAAAPIIGERLPCLLGRVAADFGVSRRFIEVRLHRYGLLDDGHHVA